MFNFPKRHAMSRARFFLEQAETCGDAERDAFECFLEAAFIFGRTAIHRLQHQYDKHPKWEEWFDSLRTNSTIEFFHTHRDFTLKEGSPRIGQIVNFNPVNRATELYYFDDPNTPATETVRYHLDLLAEIIAAAEDLFAS